MMTGYLLSADGQRIQLPAWVSWKLRRTGTVPCDSFEGVCLWEGGPDPALSRADRLVLEENGLRRFTGLLDEYELHWDEKGSRLALSGRGLAALLLDNEAEGQDYVVATLADVLRNHVTPLGIALGQVDSLPPVNGFHVAAGSSQWQVLDSFARYHGGVEPRFDELGRLSVTRAAGQSVRIGDRTGVIEAAWLDRRCRVCSEVLVRPRGLGQAQRVVNESFAAQGGRRRRVITMPRKSGYQAMRYSGQYQLDRSAAERQRLELTLAGDFLCRPGDRAEVSLTRPGLWGRWTVLETETLLDRQGLRTKLTLG